MMNPVEEEGTERSATIRDNQIRDFFRLMSSGRFILIQDGLEGVNGE
jgi:hypothetical protein